MEVAPMISRDEKFDSKIFKDKALRKISTNGEKHQDNIHSKRLSRDDGNFVENRRRLSSDDEKYGDLGMRKASEEFGVGVEYLLWKKWTLKSQVNISKLSLSILIVVHGKKTTENLFISDNIYLTECAVLGNVCDGFYAKTNMISFDV